MKSGNIEKSREDSAQNNVQPKILKKKNKVIKNGGVAITPEYIAEQRRLAKIRKEKKALEEQQKPKTVPKDLQFIKRPVLWLDNVDKKPKNRLSIMTYNLLAQSLIRRSLFPTSGDALKWSKRSVVLLSEMTHYHADIMCLQEVDDIQFHNFWVSEFDKLGYYHEFHKFGNKNHGVAVVYSKDKFKKCSVVQHVDYDSVDTVMEPRTATRNVGMILKLEFSTPELYSRKGLVVGTHHLFWHPHGTFERTRQTYVTLKAFQGFMADNQLSFNHWYSFFCGDFNAEPYHSPYLSITRKPVYYDDVAKSVVEESVKQIFDDGPDVETDPVESVDANNTEKAAYTAAAVGAPKGVPTTISAHANTALIQQLIDMHNSLPMRAISLYSVGYRHVHPENSLYRNEPDFSNWAHTWRGLLDYIFVITQWDGLDKTEVDSVEELLENEGIRIKGLLRMPARSEMSEQGQPRAGEYASDHLSMLAVVDLV